MRDIRLRPWQDSDITKLVAMANNPEIAGNLMDRFPSPYTEDDGNEFIRSSQELNPAERLAITLNGNLVGAIGINPLTDIYRRNCELGYWVGQEYWGQGIMSEAVGLMVKYTFANFDFERIFGRCFGRNKGSQRVLEKCDFVFEARLQNTIFKNDVYEDELIYAIRRSMVS